MSKKSEDGRSIMPRSRLNIAGIFGYPLSYDEDDIADDHLKLRLKEAA